MQLPLQITFRNMDPSAALEDRVRETAAKLERFHDRIMSCRVVVERQHHHHHQGDLYHVAIDLKVPGAELTTSRGPAAHHAHEDVYVAVRDAFDAMRRQLEDQARRDRGDVKVHEPSLHGRIVDVAGDAGRIETADGHSVYFHRNSVVGADFSRLAVGDEVRFAEEEGRDGPQATTVHAVGKHHVVP